MDLKELQKFPWCMPDWLRHYEVKELNEMLKQCVQCKQVELNDDIEEIIRKSREFPVAFPIETVRLDYLKDRRPIERLQNNIVSTYPIVHEKVLLLMARFITFKRQYGSDIEKDFYKDMTVVDLIDRILKKRAIAFVGARDLYKLITGEESCGGWESVGTMKQKPPLVLENCLSYDEMKLAALVYVSGHTECINDGERRNLGIFKDHAIEYNSVIIGMVGPRFARLFRMDYEDILTTKLQNVSSNGYGEDLVNSFVNMFKKMYYKFFSNRAKVMWRQLWSEFYETPNYTYDELSFKAEENKSGDDILDKYVLLPHNQYFNNEVYYKRISIIAECALLEAEHRAKESGKNAFLNVVGCGLGVWRIALHQNDIYILTFLERIQTLLEMGVLNHVTDVNFSYIPTTDPVSELFTSKKLSEEGSQDKKETFLECTKHPKGGILVQSRNRNPSSKLTNEHAGKLLVMTYAWDGNAHPGNEFWFGSLDTSGDPAAASSTQVAELHNAHVNPAVSGTNARVVCVKGIIPVSEYCASVST